MKACCSLGSKSMNWEYIDMSAFARRHIKLVFFEEDIKMNVNNIYWEYR